MATSSNHTIIVYAGASLRGEGPPIGMDMTPAAYLHLYRRNEKVWQAFLMMVEKLKDPGE